MKKIFKAGWTNTLIVWSIVVVMLFSVIPNDQVYSASSFQGLNPDDYNGVEFLSPESALIRSDSTVGGYYLNEITETYDGKSRIEFLFSMSSGMSDGLVNFTDNNLDLDVNRGDTYPTQVNIYKVDDVDSIKSDYDGNWSNDKVPVSNYLMGSLKLDPSKTISKKVDPNDKGQISLYIDNVLEDGSPILKDGAYLLEFGQYLRGNNAAKMVGVPIGFIFTVTGSYSLEDAVLEGQSLLDDTVGVMGQGKGQYDGADERDALAALLAEAATAPEDRKTDLAYEIKSAINDFKRTKVVKITLGQVEGVGSTVNVAESGQASISVTTDPNDSESYKDVTWSASNNISIDPNTGKWSAIYAGPATITAKTKWPSTFTGSITESNHNFEIRNHSDYTSLFVASGKSLSEVVANSNTIPSSTNKLKINTGINVTLSSEDLTYIKNNFSGSLTDLDLSEASFAQIDAELFKGFSKLKSVILPDNLKRIESRAFQNCALLTSVSIPSTVIFMGDDVFNGCLSVVPTIEFDPVRPPAFASSISNTFRNSSIKTLEVPYECKEDYDKYIKSKWGSSAINIIQNGTEVRLDITVNQTGGLASAAENELAAIGKKDTKIDTLYIETAGEAYLNDTKDIVYLQKHFLNATTIIMSNARHQDDRFKGGIFMGRVNVKKVRISETSTNIGNDAFNGCLNLKDIVIPASMEQMNGRVFNGCVSLPSYMVLNSTTPPSYNGSFPDNIKTIAVPNGSVETYKNTIGWKQYGDNIVPQVSVLLSSKAKTVEVQTYGTLSAQIDIKGDHVIGKGITWKSSNENIAKVDSNGKFIGLRSGTAIITASSTDFMDAESTCTVTVKNPSAPSLYKKSNTYNSAAISWSRISGASGYEIFRSTSKTGTYSKIRTVSASVNSYTDTGLKTGTYYYYKVRVYKDRSNIRYYGNYSAVIATKPVLSGVSRLKARKGGSKKIKLTWKKVSGASGYVIYRSTKKNRGYKKIKTVSRGSTLKYINKKLKKKKTYYYKVRAYRKVGSKKVYGPYSSVAKYKAR